MRIADWVLRAIVNPKSEIRNPQSAGPTCTRAVLLLRVGIMMIHALARLYRAVERTAPLFPVAVGLIVGTVLDRFSQPSPVVYVAFFLAATIATFSRTLRANVGMVLILVASLCVGGMLHFSVARTTPASSIEHYATETGRIARLCGEVVSEPRILSGGPNPFQRWAYRADRTALLVEVESIEGVESAIPVTGRVRVTVDEAVLNLRVGERVELFGLLYSLRPPSNPGVFDWAAFQRRQGVVASLRCNHRENVVRLDLGLPPAHRRPVTWLRHKARSLLTDDLATGADEEASLLEAMVLGHRSRIDRRLNDVFIKAGCTHFLAVSGIHLVIVMFFARFAARVVGLRARARTWAMIAAVILYLLLVEPRPPILRASVIALIYCVACLLGRQRFCLNWISATVIVLALLDPAMVFGVGYQLSFAAVLGVSYLAPALRESSRAARRTCERVILRRPFADEDRRLMLASPQQSGYWGAGAQRLWHWLGRYVTTGLAITFAAWLAALPVVAIHFQRVHAWGAINSFIVLPLMSLVMAFGFTKLIVSMVSPTLGAFVAAPLVAVDSFLIRSVERLASLPGAALPITAPPWWLVVSYYTFFLVVVWRFSPGVRYGVHVSTHGAPTLPLRNTPPATLRWVSATCLAACLWLIFSSLAWCWPKEASGRLVVTFLAVGPGSATVIELPDGRTVLYDAGSRRPYDVGRSTVVPFLRHRGITEIERVYVSHANLDHFCALPTVVDEIETGPIIVNSYFEPHSTPKSPSRYLLDLLATGSHPVETLELAPAIWELGGVTFELLAPLGPWDETLSSNDASTVLRLSYAGHTVMFTGDIEAKAETALLQRGELHADVLLLPHHGSVRPTSRAFVEAVGASLLIRSSHERMDETFSGLHEIIGAAQPYNTADHGAIQVAIDADGIHVSAFHP